MESRQTLLPMQADAKRSQNYLTIVLHLMDIYPTLVKLWPYPWTFQAQAAWQAVRRELGDLVQRLSNPDPISPQVRLGYAYALSHVFKERLQVLCQTLTHLAADFQEPLDREAVMTMVKPLAALLRHAEQGLQEGPWLEAHYRTFVEAMKAWQTHQGQIQAPLRQQYTLRMLRAHPVPPGIA